MKIILNILLIFLISLSSFSLKAATGEIDGKKVNVEIIEILRQAEVYPNPAEEFIYLKIDDQKVEDDIKIQVMSIIGTKMNTFSEKIGDGLYKINLNNIPSGHYYVMLSIDTNQSLKKFLKK